MHFNWILLEDFCILCSSFSHKTRTLLYIILLYPLYQLMYPGNISSSINLLLESSRLWTWVIYLWHIFQYVKVLWKFEKKFIELLWISQIRIIIFQGIHFQPAWTKFIHIYKVKVNLNYFFNEIILHDDRRKKRHRKKLKYYVVQIIVGLFSSETLKRKALYRFYLSSVHSWPCFLLFSSHKREKSRSTDEKLPLRSRNTLYWSFCWEISRSLVTNVPRTNGQESLWNSCTRAVSLRSIYLVSGKDH